jgi:histidyl-tRNA synthetase
VVVIPDGDLAVEAAEVGRICRGALRTAVDYEPRSLESKMRSASKRGARWVVLLSREEASRRVARLRDMTERTQTEVAWDELPSRLA